MKFILAQPSILRFQWELDIVLTNIASLGKHDVVLLFTKHNDSVVEHLKSRYQNIEVHVYEERDDRAYVPSVRPWLWYKYLAEDASREKETYFYIDSDIIFRELPDFKSLKVTENRWIGSDCEGYIGYDYLMTRQMGGEIVEKMAEIVGVTSEDIQKTPGAGAQWLIKNPTSDMWYKIYRDSNQIYRYFEPLNSDIQKWTAEMWSQLYNFVLAGKKIVIEKELDFCLPTDSVKMWDMVKILHNAGVVGDSRTMFYKGQYIDRTPFSDDLSYVRKDKASIKYVEAIKQVR